MPKRFAQQERDAMARAALIQGVLANGSLRAHDAELSGASLSDTRT